MQGAKIWGVSRLKEVVGKVRRRATVDERLGWNGTCSLIHLGTQILLLSWRNAIDWFVSRIEHYWMKVKKLMIIFRKHRALPTDWVQDLAGFIASDPGHSLISGFSVLISHVTLAGAQGCRFMVRHINAGVSDLDRASRPSRAYSSAKRTPYA